MKVFARTPLDLLHIRIPHGQVYLIPERCKGCELCIEFCPQHVLQVSEETNSRGYHFPSVVSSEEIACIHCEFCTLICPEFAIFTLPLNEAPDD